MIDFKMILDNFGDYIFVKNSCGDLVYTNSDLDLCLKNLQEITINDKLYSITNKNISFDGHSYSLEILKDITEYEGIIQELKKDELTQLNNRHGISAQLKTIHNIAVLNKNPYSIALGDIDFFKTVNDTYGHLIGDEVLQHISKIISQNSRNQDIIGRYGGEEFLIVLPNTSYETAYKVIERIRQKISETSLNDIFTTITFGIATWECGKTINEVIEEADKNLYVGKNNGRNQTV